MPAGFMLVCQAILPTGLSTWIPFRDKSAGIDFVDRILCQQVLYCYDKRPCRLDYPRGFHFEISLQGLT